MDNQLVQIDIIGLHGVRDYSIHIEDNKVMYSSAVIYDPLFSHPTTNLFVFFKYFAGIGASSRQVIFMGFSPSCFT